MTAVCVSPDEKFVCTLSENQTVFFFERTATCSLSPLGFCTTPLAAPLCIAWDVVGEGCLVGYKSGQLLAIPLPKEGAVDTAVSFEFECQYSLVGIRQRKLPPPVDEDDLFDVEGEDILEEKDDGPWAVQSILRVGDQYCIAMEKEELAYLYSCHIRYPGAVALPPLPPTGVEPPDYVEEPGENICYRDKLPLTVCRTLQPHTVTIVCSNGFVLVRDLEQLQTISVAGQAHDSTYFRQMTGLHISFDGSMIVSSGLDGLVVAQQVDGRPLPQVQARAVAPVRARVVEEAPPAVEAAVLSIQEQKEQDDKAKAEAAKQAIIDSFLKEIDGVHKEFTNILETNNSLPKGFQLSHAELRLDDQIEQYLQSEKEERVREARQGLLVDSVREDVRTHKLKKRFTDDLLYDRIKLFSFSNEFFVSTFRTPKGEEAIQRLEADIEDLDRSDDDESDQDNGKGGPEEEEESASAVEAPTNDKIPAERTVQTKGMSASVKQQLEKLDERRKERDERRKGYEVVLAKKPDPNVDDQKLARTLEKDIRERGECVLRTDPDYVSHDKDLKPTAKAKLQRLITLQKFVVELRTKFNVKFLEMREEKRGIIAALNKIVRRLREINALLGLDNASLSPFELTPEEQPESAFEMSREDLDEYSRVKQEEKVLAEEAKKAQRGFGADLAGATTTAREGSADARMSRSTRKESNKKSTQYSFSDRGSRASTVFASMNRERLSAELKVKLDNVKVSENEEEEREMRNAELKSEKAELERTAKAIQEDFDLKLFDLLQERGVVDSDICLSDLHLLLLFREYQLLLVFRSRDKELKRQLATLRDDSVTVEKNVESLRAKISDLEQVLARLQDEKKERKHVAETFIAEKFPADKTAYVLKVYNRKIKRKVNETDGEDDDITSDDEDEVEDEDDILEEICPPSCSVEAWERVLQLRNEKLDTQDALNMSKATSEKFSRQLGDLTNKDLVEIKENIKKCNDKKKELEKEKRKVLNMLDTIVPLRCNQIKCLNDEFRYPSHPGRLNVVVVSDSELLRLSSRLTELAAIKCERRAQLEDGASELEEVRQQKAQVQKVHASWEAKVHEVMMLKFGQHVDLEMLELCGASRRVESKKEELRQLELRWERELRKQENKIDGLRSRLQSRLIENTHLLQDFGTYEGERQQLQSSLAHSTANATNRFRSTRVATKEDRENLSELISAQQGEIAALTAEILMLKRKGGYAYSPSLY
ncbi:hypothetical protein, conserved [Angomonas deanei]|uniref:Cilia- and flagella-associated protein 43 n=1 Tax=Angomonas deanei TaxID=59799 RepID=A0A7G2CI19_9TRYP|nr:hypothetical protein, conserved [Angomonas deanei]